MTSPSNDNDTEKAESEPCPICATDAVAQYRPFCSKRCADIDLHRWLSGSYAIPAVEDDAEGAAAPEDVG